ncbi:MAG: type I-U CRISPR-associated protein Cas5/Cas6 [Firmicutes bacterium]|nr:type I-U CRISPR-associated protein Cas5/Cas6 [Bacillota bacterium]
MLTVEFRFPTGRYAATPWGRHTNEGAVEWPPSPWRILRALCAVWQARRPEVPRGDMEALLRPLYTPPLYGLPPVTQAATRHYVPVRGDRPSLMLNGMLAVDPDTPVQVHWPHADLDDAQLALLNDLLERLPYLGRAESLCWARAHREAAAVNAWPAAAAAGMAGTQAAAAPAHAAMEEGRTVEVLCPAPGTRLDDLTLDTGTLQRTHRRTLPPAARFVPYRVPPADTRSTAMRRRVQRAGAGGDVVTFFRYALTSRVKLPATQTLRLAESARRAVMSIYGRLNGGAVSETLSGRAADGRPIEGGHRHAHYLPTDEDGDGWLDHLHIWAPAGFTRAEIEALSALRTVKVPLHGRGREAGERPAEAVLVDTVLLYATADPRDPRLALVLVGPAREWESATPFVPGRHAKPRGSGETRHWVDTPEDQIRKELAARGFPDPVAVRSLPAQEARHARRASWLEYAWLRERRDVKRPGGPPGGWRITFAEAVTGPMALGYGCHFGLGQFLPARASRSAAVPE